MMKKHLIILTVILALTAFGTVSSAQAFIDPGTLTVIWGVTMIITVTGAQIFYHKTEEIRSPHHSRARTRPVRVGR